MWQYYILTAVPLEYKFLYFFLVSDKRFLNFNVLLDLTGLLTWGEGVFFFSDIMKEAVL